MLTRNDTAEISRITRLARCLRLTVLVGFVLTFGGVAQAAVYKWTDAEGVVHYTDKPPNANKEAHTVLNSRGLTVGGVERVKTEEELAEDARIAELQRQQHLAEQKSRHRDRVLLETFTTERDLLLTRDDRLGALDGTISLSQRRIDGWVGQLEQLNEQIKAYGDADIPSHLSTKRDNLQGNITRAEEYMLETMQERRRTARQFEEDLVRYRELKNDS